MPFWRLLPLPLQDWMLLPSPVGQPQPQVAIVAADLLGRHQSGNGPCTAKPRIGNQETDVRQKAAETSFRYLWNDDERGSGSTPF